MTLDDTFRQFINDHLAEQFGPDYKKIRSYIESINTRNRQISGEIDKIISNTDTYSTKFTSHENTIKLVNDNQIKFGQQTNSKITILDDNIMKISQYCEKLKKENEELKLKNNDILQRISALELECRKFSLRINEAANNKPQRAAETVINKPNTYLDSNELFDKKENTMQKDQIDDIIIKFNNWACNPYTAIPGGFTCLSGDFRIRTQQELTETSKETKWITNRIGKNKYLLPNPNYFDQMTNITELYKMNLTMLKVKGKNKIKIISPCEISSSGFIEFAGELQILP